MAIDAAAWVWDHSRSRHGARLVLLAIAYYGEVVTIGVSELGDMARLSERATRMAIAELVSLGELAVEFNAGSNSRSPRPSGSSSSSEIATGASSAVPPKI